MYFHMYKLAGKSAFLFFRFISILFKAFGVNILISNFGTNEMWVSLSSSKFVFQLVFVCYVEHIILIW